MSIKPVPLAVTCRAAGERLRARFEATVAPPVGTHSVFDVLAPLQAIVTARSAGAQSTLSRLSVFGLRSFIANPPRFISEREELKLTHVAKNKNFTL